MIVKDLIEHLLRENQNAEIRIVSRTIPDLDRVKIVHHPLGPEGWAVFWDTDLDIGDPEFWHRKPGLLIL